MFVGNSKSYTNAPHNKKNEKYYETAGSHGAVSAHKCIKTSTQMDCCV